jgi:hypothetical protein
MLILADENHVARNCARRRRVNCRHCWWPCLEAATAALYVAARVGATGRMSWTETILLAVICSVLSLVSYRNDFLSASSGFALDFFTCALCAAITLRYLAGRLGLAR